MRGDIVITAAQARDYQQARAAMRGLVIWTVTANTRDYPDHFVARPSCIDERGAQAEPLVLLGRDLNDLRLQCPPGLTILPRQPTDDRVIVECWL